MSFMDDINYEYSFAVKTKHGVICPNCEKQQPFPEGKTSKCTYCGLPFQIRED